MKGYHTIVEIDAPVDIVWEVLLDTESYPDWNPLVGKVYTDLFEGEEAEVYITPLRQKVKVNVLRCEACRELRWQGSVLAPQVVAGNHYYILEPIQNGERTLLKHGEKFTGALAVLIPPFLLDRMEAAFEEHNERLKARVERLFTHADDDLPPRPRTDDEADDDEEERERY